MTNTNFELIPCPICECKESNNFFITKDYSYNNEGPYYIVKCKECLFVFQNPRPKFQDLWMFYPKGEYFTIPYEMDHNLIETNLDVKRGFLSNIARSIIQIRYGYQYKYSGLNLALGKILNLIFGNFFKLYLSKLM